MSVNYEAVLGYGGHHRYPGLAGHPHSVDYINEWEDGARAILDTLGYYHSGLGLWQSAALNEKMDKLTP